eukprot:jgi/Chlat1/3469/Chrsp23S03673
MVLKASKVGAIAGELQNLLLFGATLYQLYRLTHDNSHLPIFFFVGCALFTLDCLFLFLQLFNLRLWHKVMCIRCTNINLLDDLFSDLPQLAWAILYIVAYNFSLVGFLLTLFSLISLVSSLIDQGSLRIEKDLFDVTGDGDDDLEEPFLNADGTRRQPHLNATNVTYDTRVPGGG